MADESTVSPSNAPHDRRRLGIMVGGLQAQDTRTQQPYFSLDLVDLDAEKTRRIPMRFLAHGFSVDPTRRHVAAVFEKKGPGACVVDLAAGRVLFDVKPLEGCTFYGHGQYGADGSVVFCVESEAATRRGLLTIRDAKDFRVLEEMPTFGKSPHDCMFLDDRTLIITNGGAPLESGENEARGAAESGCVTVVDVRTHKLVERIDIPDARLNAGHIAASSAGTFAVSSAPRDGLPDKASPGGVSFRNGGGPLLRAREPEAVTTRMLGESLSVAVHEASGVAVVTNPWGNLLTIWNARDGRLIEAREMEFPRGVTLTLDQRHFVITHGRGAVVSLYDVDGVKHVRDAASGAITGSHVFAYSPDAA